MGNTRTLIAWLVVLGLALTPHVTYAEDGGPGREVRAIRRDLPIILSHFVRQLDNNPKSLVVDDVAVSGDYALAQWHVHGNAGVDGLVNIYGRWWERMRFFPIPFASWETCSAPLTCGLGSGLDPASLASVGFPSDFGGFAARYIPATQTKQHQYEVDWYDASLFGLDPGLENAFDPDGFELRTKFAPSDAPRAARFHATGRRPMHGESWDVPQGNGYFFFSLTLDSAIALHVGTGTSVDVSFPFVLDPSKTYSLTLGHADPIVGPLNGTLYDNTLHFVLPAFAVAPGAELMGEIDGDPYNS